VTKIGESGSLKMPHKVNRVDFDNSEGNLGTTNAVLDLLSMALPVSRWKVNVLNKDAGFKFNGCGT
ncbi:adenylosuccinate lyase, partial [Tanacetum coccineum]